MESLPTKDFSPLPTYRAGYVEFMTSMSDLWFQGKSHKGRLSDADKVEITLFAQGVCNIADFAPHDTAHVSE